MDAQREGNANRGRWLAVAAIALLVGVGGLVAACTGAGTPTGAGTTSITGPAPTTSAPATQAGQAGSVAAAADVLFRGDLHRTGVYPGGGPTWRFKPSGDLGWWGDTAQPPAVSDGVVFFGSDNGYLYAVD
jgi:outer membrane protein assembly factor BamB